MFLAHAILLHLQTLNIFSMFRTQKSNLYIYPDTFSVAPSSLLRHQVSFCYHNPSVWRTSFSNFFSVGLQTMNSLGFASTQNVSISLLFLEEIFAACGIPGWQFFSTLKMCHFFLDSVCFLWEIWRHTNHCYLMGNILFDFFVDFSNLTVLHMDMDLFSFILFGIH